MGEIEWREELGKEERKREDEWARKRGEEEETGKGERKIR